VQLHKVSEKEKLPVALVQICVNLNMHHPSLVENASTTWANLQCVHEVRHETKPVLCICTSMYT
jgi:hypothetical protein